MTRVSFQMLSALVRDINISTAYHIHFERYGRQGIYARVTQAYEATRPHLFKSIPHLFKSIGEAYSEFLKLVMKEEREVSESN